MQNYFMQQLLLTDEQLSKIGFVNDIDGWNFLQPVDEEAIVVHFDIKQGMWYLRTAAGIRKRNWYEYIWIETVEELYTLLKIMNLKFNRLRSWN